MWNKVKKFINQNKTSILVLLAIMFVGIFLRAFNFHDWLRFNADQARDATLSGQVVEGKSAWPLLGPKAGGTDFRLGPVFYEFQIIAGKIFGNAPDKMAYPDLFFSILSIPLFYFFLKKYFSPRLTILLAAIYTFSFYIVKYSRFAWNPNSAPFWTILFLLALLEICDSRGGEKIFWSAAAGIAIGVGIQLHTFLLIVMPIVTIGYFVYLWFKKNNLWKNFLIVFLISIFINIPQLSNEIKTGGDNAKALFSGAAIKQENKSLLIKLGRTGECFMAANAFTVSSLGNSDKCDFLTGKTGGNPADIFLGGWLFLGVLGLGLWRIIKEPKADKRRFLGLILAYTGLIFIFMVPVAYEISLRYFLIIAFLPFVALGLWLEFFEQKFPKTGRILSVLTIALFAGLNLWTIKNTFSAWASYTQKTGLSDFDNVYLGELGAMADYIISQNDLPKNVFLAGNKTYLFKAAKGLNYMTEKRGIILKSLDKKKNNAGSIVFYLVDAKAKDKQQSSLKSSSELLDFQSFGRFGLFKARLKN